jgi:hypothetical protein
MQLSGLPPCSLRNHKLFGIGYDGDERSLAIELMSTELGQSGQSRISRESCFLFPGPRTIIVRCEVPSALLADDGIKTQQANLRSSWIRNLSLNCASGSSSDFCSQCSSANAASNAGAERAELNDMLRIA